MKIVVNEIFGVFEKFKSGQCSYDRALEDASKIMWMKDWVDKTSQVKYENSFNEKSDEWIEIEGIGKFKGLKIVSEQHDELNEITINLKYDVWDKNVL